MKGIVILGIKVHLIWTVTQLICNKNMNFQKKYFVTHFVCIPKMKKIISALGGLLYGSIRVSQKRNELISLKIHV